MALTLPAAAARLRREFANTEATIDRLLLELGAIQHTIITARAEAGVPIHAAQETLLRLQRVAAQTLSAQSDMFRAHDSIAKVGRELMGPEEPYTPASGLLTDADTAQAVAVAA